MKRWLIAIALGLVVVPAFELGLEAREAALVRQSSTMMHLDASYVRYSRTSGHNQRPLVVLLNGFSGAIEQWAYAVPVLSTNFRVLAYDRVGLGFSDAVEHGVRAQSTELLALLDSLGEHGPLLLVGFSHSASLARLLAAEHPDRVAGLALVAPYLPEIENKDIPSRRSGIRTYGRLVLSSMASCLFGMRRVRERFAPVERDSVRHQVQVINRRFWHWKSNLDEILAFEETGRIVMASPPLVRPVVLLKGPISSRYGTAYAAAIRDVVGRASDARVVLLPNVAHGEEINDTTSLRVLNATLLSLAL